jgi:signal transduction histidine kinase
MVKDLLGLRRRRTPAPGQEDGRLMAERARALVAASGESLIIVDDADRIAAVSPRAQAALPGLAIGGSVPEGVQLETRVEYEAGGRGEALLRLADPDPELTAYEELRSGFTAVVSHELRTPLARLLALLETALLPDSDRDVLVEQARAEVEQIRELVDEVLFLSELETGREVVSLGATTALPILREVLSELAATAGRAGVAVSADGDPNLTVPLRPRMLRVVAANLSENALRYAGPGASFRLSVEAVDGSVALRATDDGVGVPDEDLPRLFERFYRADRARASRGTGLGLAIVKHIVTSAGGRIEADRAGEHGLEIRCIFPAS